MRASIRRLVFVLAAVLVAISGLGAMVAGQQYVLLVATRDIALSQRMLEDTFLSTLKMTGGGSTPEIEKEVVAHKARIEEISSSSAALASQIEIRVIADFGAWCLVFILSSLVLFLGRKRDP